MTQGIPQPGRAEVVTYLTDAVDPHPEDQDGVRVGTPVQLRPRADGRTVEAWSPRHGRLGRLPPDEGEVLAPLLLREGLQDGLDARVSALVPRPGRPGGTRIHIRLAAPEPA